VLVGFTTLDHDASFLGRRDVPRRASFLVHDVRNAQFASDLAIGLR
jgi:hypothetical protein